MSMAGKHGPDKLYDKFRVTKVSSGNELNRPEDPEFFFVLRPEKDDPAAVAALHTYAAVCEQQGYSDLAYQIRLRLRSIEDGELPAQSPKEPR